MSSSTRKETRRPSKKTAVLPEPMLRGSGFKKRRGELYGFPLLFLSFVNENSTRESLLHFPAERSKYEKRRLAICILCERPQLFPAHAAGLNRSRSAQGRIRENHFLLAFRPDFGSRTKRCRIFAVQGPSRRKAAPPVSSSAVVFLLFRC